MADISAERHPKCAPAPAGRRRMVLWLVASGLVAALLFLAQPAPGAEQGSLPSSTGSGEVPGVVLQGTSLCDTSGVAQFSDVAPGDYGAEYILCMRALGLSSGTGDGSYGADRDLTRGQMATFLVRMWRDVLGRECPSGLPPFTDVGMNDTHAANIACLYNLEITKGKTATTYEPQGKLTAVHISRFLARTWIKAGHTCADRSTDLDLDGAVSCLHDLRVIPSTEEGRSGTTVIRSQMAVYMIGLTYNLVEGGLPPLPPARPGGPAVEPPPVEPPPPVDNLLFEDDYLVPADRSVRVQTEGTRSIPVYMCAPEGTYSSEHLAHDVKELNREVSPLFRWQSSQKMDLVFEVGGIVSPPDIAGRGSYLTSQSSAGNNACANSALLLSDTSQILLLVFVSEGSGGYAYLTTGPAIAAWYPPAPNYRVAAHEIAHSVFGLRHWYNAAVGSIFGFLETADPAAVIGSGEVDLARWRFTPIMACYQREQLGWPVGEDSPPCLRLRPSELDVSVRPGIGEVTVSWTEPTFTDGVPVTGYTVKIEEILDTGDYVPVAEYHASPDVRSHIFDDLMPLKQYAASVVVTTIYGTSDRGFPEDFNVRVSPDIVEVTNLAPYGFTLSWVPVEGASHYRLSGFGQYQIRETSGSFRNVYEPTATIEASPSTQIEPNTDYRILIQACFPGNPITDCWDYVTVDVTTPSLSEILSSPAVTATGGDTWVDLVWNPVAGAEWYLLTSGSEKFRLPGVYWTRFRITPLEPEKSYTFEIQACVHPNSPVDVCGIGTKVSVSTVAKESVAPPDPVGEATAIVGDTWVKLLWDAVPDAEVYRLAHDGGLYTQGGTRGGTRYRYDDLEPATAYTFWIDVCRTVGSKYTCSNLATLPVTTATPQPALPPPDPPGGFEVVDTGDTWIELTWDSVAGAEEYRLSHDRIPGGYYVINPVSHDFKANRFRIPRLELEPDTTYTFKLIVCSIQGHSFLCSQPATVSGSTKP